MAVPAHLSRQRWQRRRRDSLAIVDFAELVHACRLVITGTHRRYAGIALSFLEMAMGTLRSVRLRNRMRFLRQAADPSRSSGEVFFFSEFSPV
jgi:hypothetical protein